MNDSQTTPSSLPGTLPPGIDAAPSPCAQPAEESPQVGCRPWLRKRWVFVGAMALLFGLLAWHYHGTMVRAYRTSPEHGLAGIDATTYLRSAREVAEGRPPLMFGVPFYYPYPLTLTWLLIPIAYLPYGLAQTLWFLLQVASGALAIAFIAGDAIRFSLIRFTDRAWLYLAIAFAITYEIPQSHLRNGQLNALLLLCCILAYRWHWKGRPVASAAVLGLGIALKYFPLVMMPYFFLRKQYGICLNAVLFAILFASVPALWMGDAFYESYAYLLPNGFLSFAGSTHAHAPVYSSLYRAVGFFVPAVLDMRWVQGACFLAIVLPLAWVDWRGTNPDCRRQTPHDLYTVCLWLVSFALVSPHLQAHYLVFLLPGLVLAMLRVMRTRRMDEALLLLAYFPLHFFGHDFGRYPVYFASIFTLYLLLFLQRRRAMADPVWRAALLVTPNECMTGNNRIGTAQ